MVGPKEKRRSARLKSAYASCINYPCDYNNLLSNLRDFSRLDTLSAHALFVEDFAPSEPFGPFRGTPCAFPLQVYLKVL